MNNYLTTRDFFAASKEVAWDGIDNGAFSEQFNVLHAPEHGIASGNGVYAYGTALVAPTQSYQASNYWVDVSFRPTATQSNGQPVFTSGNFTVAENSASIGVVTATDVNRDSLTYAIAGGGDAALFNINATTGALSFKSAPDFEAAADVGRDNTYDLKLSVTDGRSAPVTKDIQVKVLDVDEHDVTKPVDSNTAANTVSVGTAAGTLVGVTAFAKDADATTNAVTYSLTNNAGGRFQINAATGIVSVSSGATFDANTPTHQITVLATSADNSAATETFVINVAGLSRFKVVLTGGNDAYTAPAGRSYEVQGLAGNDIIVTSAGDDLVDGGRGDDRMTGGAGADVFAFLSDHPSREVDVITDFATVDRIQLATGNSVTSVSLSNVGGRADLSDTVLQLSSRDSIHLLDFSGWNNSLLSA
jgi:Ca2+-binding RTX toxin-like protein